MGDQLESVVLLHKTQTALAEARERLEGVPDWMRELHEQHSQKKAEIDGVEATRDEAARVRRTAEAELEDAQVRSKRYQEQLGQVSTEREYSAMLKEIDTVKEQINNLEKQLLEAIESHDQGEKDLEVLKEGFRELDESYNAELAKWDAEKPAIRQSIEEYDSKLNELREALPRPILSLFDRIYERNDGTAVTPVIKLSTRSANAMWHCQACSYNVRPQVVVEIRNDGTITQCDSCKLILYLEEE